MLKPAAMTVLLSVLLTTGCGRKETPATAPAAGKPAPAVAVDSPAAEPAPAPPAAVQPAPATAPAGDDAIGADLGNAYLNDLQSIVDSYCAVTKRKPADFSQLISAGYMSAMPPAPAGKKYAIDPGTAKVKLVNR